MCSLFSTNVQTNSCGDIPGPRNADFRDFTAAAAGLKGALRPYEGAAVGDGLLATRGTERVGTLAVLVSSVFFEVDSESRDRRGDKRRGGGETGNPGGTYVSQHQFIKKIVTSA